MRDALTLADLVIPGVAMVAITFAYVEIQPRNQTVETDDAYSLPVKAR